jgi:hypothetical protein
MAKMLLAFLSFTFPSNTNHILKKRIFKYKIILFSKSSLIGIGGGGGGDKKILIYSLDTYFIFSE